MFEGTPHVYLDAPNSWLFAISILCCGLVMWIRQSYLKEWKLADWAFNNINRVWQRGADEVPQAEGIIISHLAGILAYGILAWEIWSLFIGLAVGLVLLVLRQVLFQIISLFPKTHILSKEHNIIDRVTRMWMSLAVGGSAVIIALLPDTSFFPSNIILFSIWGASVLFRWYRVFQSAKRRLHRYSNSFLYLCALEILPVLVFVQVMITALKGI